MYVFFDTETTGLPRNWKAPVTDLDNWPRLVQLAWLVFDKDGNELAFADHIVRPDGFTIPKDASDVHRITTERALAEGEALLSVMEKFEAAGGNLYRSRISANRPDMDRGGITIWRRGRAPYRLGITR